MPKVNNSDDEGTSYVVLPVMPSSVVDATRHQN